MAKYYEELSGRAIVAEEAAFDYAADKCGILVNDPDAPNAEEFREMLVEWFFSGNWIEREDEEDEEDY